MLYKTVTEKYFDLLHMWNTWWASSVKNLKKHILLWIKRQLCVLLAAVV